MEISLIGFSLSLHNKYLTSYDILNLPKIQKLLSVSKTKLIYKI